MGFLIKILKVSSMKNAAIFLISTLMFEWILGIGSFIVSTGKNDYDSDLAS